MAHNDSSNAWFFMLLPFLLLGSWTFAFVGCVAPGAPLSRCCLYDWDRSIFTPLFRCVGMLLLVSVLTWSVNLLQFCFAWCGYAAGAIQEILLYLPLIPTTCMLLSWGSAPAPTVGVCTPIPLSSFLPPPFSQRTGEAEKLPWSSTKTAL